MSIFKSKEEKEFEKKLVLKRTIAEMGKQLKKLEEQKDFYLEKAKEAKLHGLGNELSLAVSALKSAMSQEKRIREMKINFEIMVSLKDMLKTTSEFLNGMASLSKDMVKLTDDKQFAEVSKQFSLAMHSAEKQQERMEIFLENSKDSFSSVSDKGDISTKDIMSLVNEGLGQDGPADEVDSTMAEIESKLQKNG